MMDTNDTGNDPMNFMRNLWGNMGGFNLPGMVTPTFDVNELEKRISDLKAVEGWLRMNLSMLQMTIQGLEMQRATLSVVQAMGDAASKASEVAQGKHEASPPPPPPPPVEPVVETPAGDGGNSEAISQAALWPWTLMQQMQEAMQQAQPAEASKPAAKPRARRPAAKGKAKAK